MLFESETNIPGLMSVLSVEMSHARTILLLVLLNFKYVILYYHPLVCVYSLPTVYNYL